MEMGSWFGTRKSGLVGTFVDGVNMKNSLTMLRSTDFPYKLEYFFVTETGQLHVTRPKEADV